jgi:hypothetical protein
MIMSIEPSSGKSKSERLGWKIKLKVKLASQAYFQFKVHTPNTHTLAEKFCCCELAMNIGIVFFLHYAFE